MTFDINSLNKDSGIAITTINDVEYTIQLLPASKGMALGIEISKLIAPSIGAGVDGLSRDEVLHGAPETFTQLASLFVQQLYKVDLSKIVGVLLDGLEANGERVNFDTHFRGNYGTLAQLIKFALKENFESFFTESGLVTHFNSMMKSMVANRAQPQESEESLES